MKIKSRFTKVAVAAGLTVASGAGVLGLTGFASAQMAGNKTAVVQTADSNDAASTSTVVVGADGTVAGTASVEAMSEAANRPNPIAVVAKALGMTEADLITELQSGKSVADVAKAKNVDLADVKAALVADLKAHLDAEVASGEHTQAEADAKLTEMQSRLDQMLNEVGGPRGPRGGDHGGMGRHGGPGRMVTEGLAGVLNLSTTELQTQLQSGKSLADIAKAQNVDLADVKAQLVKDFEAHLADEVKSGEHTQADADQKSTEFKARLDDMVNGVRPQGGPEGRGDHDGRHGHGPMGARPGQAPGSNGTGQSSSGSM